jgi:hypothetical protein
MKKACLLPIALVLMLAIASIPNAQCGYPPAGIDHLDPTTAIIELQTGMFNETITVTGPTYVNRSQPYDPGDGHMKINTTIIFMNLVGMSAYLGQMIVNVNPSKISNGTVRQINAYQDFPAYSVFDVYVVINVTILNITLHNDNPSIMSATIYNIPPWGANYTGNQTVALTNETGYPFGFMKHVVHKVGPLPSVGGSTFFVDALRLLAPYIGLVSMITVSAAATAIYVKRAKRRKEKH